VALDAFVAPNATLVGDVLMLTQSSVWYGAVLRGDRNKITVGAFSNIQDKVVIDCTSELETGFPAEVDILNHVTVGHGAVLRSCVIKDRCIVGMNAVISEGCVMERTSMVAAGSVLLPHTVVPSGQLWAGNPAVYIRDLKFEEIESFEKVMLHPLSLSHSLTHSLTQ
jgi:carbonic anhydrase/acetyltransferase-like protein (isoleucine patch superfamily)